MKADTKQCLGCELNLPFSAFATAKRGRYGLQSRCRDCKRTYDARRYSENRESILAQTAQWRAQNADHIRDYHLAWEQRNREHLRAYQRERAARARSAS